MTQSPASSARSVTSGPIPSPSVSPAGRAVLVAANFGAQPVEQPLETPARLLLESTGSPAPLAAALAKGQLALAPCQAAVLALAPEKIPEEVPEQAGA